MALANMKVFDRYVKEATIETLAQMVEKFNAASAGSIQLTTDGFTGDFMHEIMWKAVHTAQRRVDRYASNASASATALEQIDKTGVKIAGGFGPILFEPAQLTYMLDNPAEAVEMASRNLAEAIMADQLNSAIAALVAALNNNANVKNDVSTGSQAAKLSYAALNAAHAKFGDRSGEIVANVITGATYHHLIGLNIANGSNLFQSSGVTVVDILGKAMIVTDAPALYAAAVPSPSTPAKSRALGLTVGAAVVHDGGDLITNTETSNGKQRIEATFQADYTFGLALKGYAWDVTTGGKTPTDAEIATGGNWDKIVTSDKMTAGVIAIGLAS